VPRSRAAAQALLPFALHGLARLIDAQVGLLLHSSLALSYPREVSTLLARDPAAVAVVLGLWLAGGAAAWACVAVLRARSEGGGLAQALEAEAGSFAPLYVRPALTTLALVSLAIHPTFPYAFTLPVALTQDWGIAQDALAASWFVAARLSTPRLPAPSAAAVFLLSFVAYALVTPESARQWEGHPGNEPKYLRQGVALAHELSFDAEGVSAPMEDLEPRPLGDGLRRAAATIIGETARMAKALASGPDAVGKDAIRATRITRQTIGGKEGGVYYVLAPGPSLLLAPTLRIDRALNRARGTPGRLAVSVLAWNALGAGLVAALFLLVRDATGRAGLATALALAFAFLPPFLFYFFQFYPEMVGALLLAVAYRSLAFSRPFTVRIGLLLGLVLLALPWLHQKFLPVWGVLTLTALVLLYRLRAPRAVVLALLVPQAIGLFLTALYNFAITGSVRPDALFLAWGPAGVTTARIGQGLFGLLFDARYGLLPCAPIYLLVGAGLVFAWRERSPLLWCLPSAVVYYLTVAAADNWAGAVCNLGRYLMPLCPLAVAFVALALARAGSRRGAWTVVLALLAWSGLIGFELWQDPHAANDTWELMDKSLLADANAYVPNLFMLRFREAAPGLVPRVVFWCAAVAGLAFWWIRGADSKAGASAARAAVGLALVALGAAMALEAFGSRRDEPRFAAVEADEGARVFVSGSAGVREGVAVARSGEAHVLVRSPQPRNAARVLIGGRGVFQVPGQPAVAARPGGAFVDLPLAEVAHLTAADGAQEWLSRGALRVEGEVVLRFSEPSGNPSSAGLVHE
jgi:hypothetical protein